MNPRITKEQLHRLLFLVPRSEKVETAARLVWVEGHEKATAARMMGVSRSALGQMLDRLRKYWPEILGLPASFEIISVAVPKGAIKEVEKVANEAVQQWLASHPDWAPRP